MQFLKKKYIAVDIEMAIQIIEKPDWVTWNQIQEVVSAAHKQNWERGVVMLNSKLTGEEISSKLGSMGKMFVALDGEKVVGTAGFKIKEASLWFGTRNFGYCCFAAILPEYNGKGIYKLLCEVREKFAVSQGVEMMMFDTHERNSHVIQVNKHVGFEFVDYKPCKDHNNVVMVKWLSVCPYSQKTLALHYWIEKIRVRISKRIKGLTQK